MFEANVTSDVFEGLNNYGFACIREQENLFQGNVGAMTRIYCKDESRTVRVVSMHRDKDPGWILIVISWDIKV